MSLRDNELHAVAGGGVTVLVGVMAVLLVVSGRSGCAGGNANAEPNPLEDMEAIEASIAYKKAPAKQPQKKTRTPEPEKKAEGVSRDETKKPDEQKKKPEDAKPVTNPKDAIPDRKPKDEDLPENQKPVTDVGEFNDSTRGFAETTSGDPFFRELAADFHENWEFPKILSATASAAGCLHILADGTIKKTKVDPKSGDDALDDSVERALKKMEKLRNGKPVAVPTHLLKQATTRWICFKTKSQEQQRE